MVLRNPIDYRKHSTDIIICQAISPLLLAKSYILEIAQITKISLVIRIKILFLHANVEKMVKIPYNFLQFLIWKVDMIDELDLKLLQELQKDGVRSYVELGRMLGVVEGTVRKRIKDLKDKNILKIVGVPNVSELGYGFMNFMALQVRMAELREVANALARKPNVCYLAFVTGRYDLIAVIVTRTPQELSHFIEAEVSSIPGILRTETFVNLDIIKGGWSGIDTTQLIDNLDPSLLKQRQKRK